MAVVLPQRPRGLCSATLIPPSRRDHRSKKNTIFQARCYVSLLLQCSLEKLDGVFVGLILPHTSFQRGNNTCITDTTNHTAVALKIYFGYKYIIFDFAYFVKDFICKFAYFGGFNKCLKIFLYKFYKAEELQRIK